MCHKVSGNVAAIVLGMREFDGKPFSGYQVFRLLNDLNIKVSHQQVYRYLATLRDTYEYNRDCVLGRNKKETNLYKYKFPFGFYSAINLLTVPVSAYGLLNDEERLKLIELLEKEYTTVNMYEAHIISAKISILQ